MADLWIEVGSGAVRAAGVSEVSVTKSSRVVGGRMSRDRYAVVLRFFGSANTAGKSRTRAVWSCDRESDAERVARELLRHLITDAARPGDLVVHPTGEIELREG